MRTNRAWRIPTKGIPQQPHWVKPWHLLALCFISIFLINVWFEIDIFAYQHRRLMEIIMSEYGNEYYDSPKYYP